MLTELILQNSYLSSWNLILSAEQIMGIALEDTSE